MENKKILITGAGGFIGNRCGEILKSKSAFVIGIGHTNLYTDYSCFNQYVESEINTESLLKIKQKFDIIIHCAGSNSIQKSFIDPSNDFNINVLSVIEVLEYIRQSNPGAIFIYLSSGAVYGQKPNAIISESDICNPISPYGYSKKIGEEITEMYSKIYGIHVLILRLFSVYGPKLNRQLMWDACKKFTSNEDDEAIFWGTGKETRDWIYIDDVIELISHALKAEGKFNIFNGGTGICIENQLILHLLRDALSSKKKIIFNNAIREGDPFYMRASIQKLNNLSWKYKTDINTGINNYTKWFTHQADLK